MKIKIRVCNGSINYNKNVKKIHKEDVVLIQMGKFDYAYHLSHQLTKVANWLRTVTKSCKIKTKNSKKVLTWNYKDDNIILLIKTQQKICQKLLKKT